MAFPTIDSSTDWTSTTFLNAFVDQIRNRAKSAVYVDYFSTWGDAAYDVPGWWPHVVAGDDVQQANMFAMMQGQIELFVPAYLKPDFAPDGASIADNPILDFYKPSSTQQQYWYTIEEAFAAAGFSDGWTRKKPREIASTSATVDVDGNTVADGMRAFLAGAHTAAGSLVYEFDGTDWVRDGENLTFWPWVGVAPADVVFSDTLFGRPTAHRRRILSTASTSDVFGNAVVAGQRAYIRSGDISAGRIYERVAGAWVVAIHPTARPDTLTSGPLTGSGCAFGKVEVGDFIGLHLFEQMRDVMLLCSRTICLPYRAATNVAVVFDTDHLEVQNVGPTPIDGPGSAYSYHQNGADYIGEVSGVELAYFFPSHVDKSVDLVVAMDIYSSTDEHGDPVDGTFDAQGQSIATGATQNHWHAWHNNASAGTGFSVDTLSPTAPPNPSSGYGHFRGFYTTSPFWAIITWDF